MHRHFCSIKNILWSHLLHFPQLLSLLSISSLLCLCSEWPSANQQGEQYEKPNKQSCASKTRLTKEVRAQELKQRTSLEVVGISCPEQFWQKARAFTLLFDLLKCCL